MRNRVPNLAYAGRVDQVSTVIVDGQIELEDGRLVGICERDVVLSAQRQAERVSPRATEPFWQVGGACARTMAGEAVMKRTPPDGVRWELDGHGRGLSCGRM